MRLSEKSCDYQEIVQFSSLSGQSESSAEFFTHHSFVSLLRLNFFLRVSSAPIPTALPIRPRGTCEHLFL